jgi:hypothetical protein
VQAHFFLRSTHTNDTFSIRELPAQLDPRTTPGAPAQSIYPATSHPLQPLLPPDPVEINSASASTQGDSSDSLQPLATLAPSDPIMSTAASSPSSALPGPISPHAGSTASAQSVSPAISHPLQVSGNDPTMTLILSFLNKYIGRQARLLARLLVFDVLLNILNAYLKSI